MNKQEAIKFLASRIFQKGPSEVEGQYCLVPEDFVDVPTVFNQISTFLFETEKFTHYDLSWIKIPKIVKVRLYSGEAFGACLNLNFIEEHEVVLE